MLIPRLVLNHYILSSPLLFSVAMIASETINKLQVQMGAAHARNSHSQPSCTACLDPGASNIRQAATMRICPGFTTTRCFGVALRYYFASSCWRFCSFKMTEATLSLIFLRFPPRSRPIRDLMLENASIELRKGRSSGQRWALLKSYLGTGGIAWILLVWQCWG